MVVLTPWNEPGSLDYRIIEADRASFLDGRHAATARAVSTEEHWWLPVAEDEALATVAAARNSSSRSWQATREGPGRSVVRD
jgi:hypothetical protein